MVVIGGGVVGAGGALDAVTRGLSVALVEARDFASGTSSRASKLFHGGLRYLEQLEFGLVREALHERELTLTTIRPHLVKPLSFLYPLTKRWWERPYVAAGIILYDQLGGAQSVPAHKHLTKAGALRLVPGLRRDALVGGIRYYDTVGRRRPAHADRRAHRRALRRGGADVDPGGRVAAGMRPGDRRPGPRLRGRRGRPRSGHVVINSTGVWTDEMQALSSERGRFRVRASKGVHLVVPRDRIVSEVAIILQTEKSVLFVIPWNTHWIIGTTDTDWNLDLAHPAATKADIDYILDHVNKVLAMPLTHDDIEGVYAGLRPLLAGESEETSKLSREHAVARCRRPGLIAIAGGKYTTYRVMGADAVDAAAEDLPARVNPSITEKVPLLGAVGYFALVNQTEQRRRAARRASVPGPAPAGPVRLADRRGAGAGRADGRTCWTPITDAAGLPAGRGACTRSPTRARCIWRTCWPGGPGSPSSTRTAASTAPRGRRGRGAGAGLEPRGRRPRGRDVPGQGRGRGAVADRSPTTSPPMRCGPRRRRRAPRSSSRCR